MMNDQTGTEVEELYLERQFELKWRIGARTAAFIVQVAAGFESRVQIMHGDLTANARAMMALMLLDIALGSRIRVRISGPDAAAAMRAFATIFTCGPRQERCLHEECPSTPILLDCGKGCVSYGCSKWHFWDVTGSSNTLIQIGLKAWEPPTVGVSVN